MSSPSTHRRFSLVRPNPFLGTLQVLEIEGARAVTADGLNWEIQVVSERPANLWGSLSQGRTLTDYYTFGVWSRPEGLARVPVHPLFDVGAMLEESGRIIALLEAEASGVPFEPLPAFELWLLDEAERRPLALLAITADETARRAVRRPAHWAAARRGDNAFRAPSLDARGVPGRDPGNPRRHLSALERQVTGAAGSTRLAQWFWREPDGGATGLADDVPGDLAVRALPASAFPELLLREQWPEPGQTELVQDYMDWLAPRLLTLPGIADATRARLERTARHQAAVVDRLWRAYPKVLDRALIEEARVEARLRRVNAGDG
ncbi:MAG: hypothetical protein PVF91_07175 [Chromatiales bacterium]